MLLSILYLLRNKSVYLGPEYQAGLPMTSACFQCMQLLRKAIVFYGIWSYAESTAEYSFALLVPEWNSRIQLNPILRH